MIITDTHVYFWGGVFSQWLSSRFQAELPDTIEHIDDVPISTGITLSFNCAEQYMMAAKASVFGDEDSLRQILATRDPQKQKAIGRNVVGYNDEIWAKHRLEIVTYGSICKFASPEMKPQLLETGDRHIVEGSPYDKIWGVGLRFDDPAILDESNWDGLNLLGVALMDARKYWQQHEWLLPILFDKGHVVPID